MHYKGLNYSFQNDVFSVLMCPVFISQFDFVYFSVICAACHMAQGLVECVSVSKLTRTQLGSCGIGHGIIA